MATPAAAEGDGHLLDDLRPGWPAAVDSGAEDATRPGPGVTDLEDEAVVDRKPDQVRQAGIRIRVARDDEVRGHRLRLDREPPGEGLPPT